MEKERGMADGVDKNDIENMLEILDSFANSEESRLKVEAVENLPQGTAQNPLENVVKFERSPRLKLSVPQGEVDIQAPPSVGSKPTVNWVQVILPSLGTVAFRLWSRLYLG